MWEFLGGKKLLDKLAMDLQLEYPEITFQAHSPEIIFGTIWKVFLDFYSSQSNRTMWRRKWHRTSYDGPKAMVRQLDFPKLFWSFIENFWILSFLWTEKKLQLWYRHRLSMSVRLLARLAVTCQLTPTHRTWSNHGPWIGHPNFYSDQPFWKLCTVNAMENKNFLSYV